MDSAAPFRVEFHRILCYAFLMRVTFEIPDELAELVETRGFVLESYVRSLMEENLSPPSIQVDGRRQAVEAMLQFAEKHGATLGGLDLKKTVHEGHNY